MEMRMTIFVTGRWAAFALAALAVSGCANRAPVKEVLADPAGYMAKFGAVPPEIAKGLPSGETPVAFRRIEVQYKATEVRSDAATRDLTMTRTITPDSMPGVVRIHDVVNNNGVPFRDNFKIAYRGIYALKWQTVFTNRAAADLVYEVKALSRMDSLSRPGPKPSEFVFTFGSQPQMAGFYTGRDVCTFGAEKAASSLASAFEGKLTEISCENYGSNGQVISKVTYAYLQHYGVALLTGSTDSTAKMTQQITSVRVE
jgi:hypothetical protein